MIKIIKHLLLFIYYIEYNYYNKQYNSDSIYCHNLLEPLAKKFDHIKFVEIYGNEALKSFTAAGCPLINVYKQGELFKCFIKITDKLGQNYNLDDLEWFFESYNLL